MTAPDTSNHESQTDGTERSVPAQRSGDQPLAPMGRTATAAALNALRVDTAPLDDLARKELGAALAAQLDALGYGAELGYGDPPSDSVS